MHWGPLSRAVSLLVAVLAASCRGSAPRTAASSAVAVRTGQFAFIANMPGGYRMTGSIVVAGDTIVLQPSAGLCGPLPGATDATYFLVRCAISGFQDVVFALDRRNPVLRSTWSAGSAVARSREVCVEYRVFEDGRRVCRRRERETYEEIVRQSGALVVTR